MCQIDPQLRGKRLLLRRYIYDLRNRRTKEGRFGRTCDQIWGRCRLILEINKNVPLW